MRTVLLIGKTSIMVEGLRRLLEDYAQISLIASSSKREDYVSLARQFAPDVIVYVVFDDRLAVDTVRKLRQEVPRATTLIVSRNLSKASIAEMLKTGVRGILLDDTSFADLINLILPEETNRNQVCLDRRIIDAMTGVRDAALEISSSALSDRERLVFQSLVEGRNTKQIAAELGVSPKTVDTYRRRLMQKLAITSIADLVKLAIREGLTTVEPPTSK